MLDLAGKLVQMPAVSGIEWGGLSHLLVWTGVGLALPAMLAGFTDYARLPAAVRESNALLAHIAFMFVAWSLFLLAAIWRIRNGYFAGAASWPVTSIEILASACLVAGGHCAATVVFEKLPAAKGR